MPLNPSSYKKIFKSKYVQDDSDEEVETGNDDDLDLEYKPSTSTSISASYTPPSIVSSSYATKKIPMLTSAYLDSHPELNFGSSSSTNYNSTSLSSSSYLDSISKPRSTASYSHDRSLSSTYPDSTSFSSQDRSSISRLPPLPPRSTPSRRILDDSINSERFQSRPLRNLTVLSRSVTPVHSVNRSPSPVDSLSWRSNKSVTPAPRRIYPQTSATVDLDDLIGKDESPIVFDANLTFVLGTKGKMKQHVTPIPAHVEKDTASNCLTDKIQDFLKRTDHVMEEWKNTGQHKRDNNNNMSVKERALMGRSKSATNIMIKGFQLYSRANSCSRSSIGKDTSEDCCTEAEVDEVLASNENGTLQTACILPAN